MQLSDLFATLSGIYTIVMPDTLYILAGLLGLVGLVIVGQRRRPSARPGKFRVVYEDEGDPMLASLRTFSTFEAASGFAQGIDAGRNAEVLCVVTGAAGKNYGDHELSDHYEERYGG